MFRIIIHHNPGFPSVTLLALYVNLGQHLRCSSLLMCFPAPPTMAERVPRKQKSDQRCRIERQRRPLFVANFCRTVISRLSRRHGIRKRGSEVCIGGNQLVISADLEKQTHMPKLAALAGKQSISKAPAPKLIYFCEWYGHLEFCSFRELAMQLASYWPQMTCTI